MKNKAKDRITVRLYQRQIKMLDKLIKTIGEDVNKSDIVRYLIEGAAKNV
jgi:Arc/MetJ-type ribon-helix-helix transcriptional regulator